MCQSQEKICSVCGSNHRVSLHTKSNLLVCSKHRHQLDKYGFIKSKTNMDRNEVIIYDNYAEIILYNYKNTEVARTQIDLDIVDIIKDYKWCCSRGYAITNIKGKTLFLHHLVLPPTKENEFVDHIDRNRLNNKLSNLRLCTNQQNSMNITVQKNNKSGITGVCWHSQTNKWRAYIMVNGKQISLGLYYLIDDAIEARKEAEKKYFGEFAPM